MKKLGNVVFKCVVLAVFGLVVGHAAIADQINFDPLALVPTSNGTPIPDGYGSTANVAVTYNTLTTFSTSGGTVVDPFIRFWNTGYGDMATAGYEATNGLVGQITLTPLNGTTLTLDNFTMAGWYFQDKPDQTVETVNGINSHIWSPVTIPGCCQATGGSHVTFVSGVSSTGAISIEWGTDYNAGINYINFDSSATPAVPEPATLSLLAAGLLGLAARRKARAS
jgi:hypothetical protein